MVIPQRSTSLQRGVPAPFTAVRVDTWVLSLLEADLDEQGETLSGLAGGSCVVLRSDGGLWIAVGNSHHWSIFGVPATAWRPAASISGVLPRVQVDPVRKVG